MNDQATPENRPARLQSFAETSLIFVLFFALAGTPPPEVNEAHYLAKAKHYWDPAWCPADHFLNTADAHQVFYWTFGFLPRVVDLPIAAWLGRILTWGLLAWSWQRLSVSLVPLRMFSIFTAAAFTMLLHWGHMAGEWVIGGIEAKGFAYVLVWLAIESLVRANWRRACLLLGAASAFHVLVGGWSFIAACFAWIFSDRDRRPPLLTLLPFLAGGGLLALFGLIPALALSWSESPDIVREANRIYVFERLPHHLVFHSMPHHYMLRHAALLCVWLAGIYFRPRGTNASWDGWRRFHCFVAGAVAIATVGIILDQSLLYFRPLAASILRYYWFRLSDVMIPAGAAFVAALWLAESFQARRPAFKWWLAAALALLSAHVGYVVYEHAIDPRPGAVVQAMSGDGRSIKELIQKYDAWRNACAWIHAHTPPDANFLTPRHQQSFHWDAGRSEVVCAKNVPQDAQGIVQWRQRMDDVFPWTVRFADLTAHGEERLRQLAEKYKFQYIIVDRSVSPRPLTFPRVYPENSETRRWYEVYRVE